MVSGRVGQPVLPDASGPGQNWWTWSQVTQSVESLLEPSYVGAAPPLMGRDSGITSRALGGIVTSAF